MISCASEIVKGLLIAEIKKSALAHSLKNDIIAEVNTMPGCASGEPIGFSRPSKKAKGERKRSAYQEFVSGCMKAANIKGFGEAPVAMKKCAAQWRSQKK